MCGSTVTPCNLLLSADSTLLEGYHVMPQPGMWGHGWSNFVVYWKLGLLHGRTNATCDVVPHPACAEHLSGKP